MSSLSFSDHQVPRCLISSSSLFFLLCVLIKVHTNSFVIPVHLAMLHPGLVPSLSYWGRCVSHVSPLRWTCKALAFLSSIPLFAPVCSYSYCCSKRMVLLNRILVDSYIFLLFMIPTLSFWCWFGGTAILFCWICWNFFNSPIVPFFCKCMPFLLLQSPFCLFAGDTWFCKSFFFLFCLFPG